MLKNKIAAAVLLAATAPFAAWAAPVATFTNSALFSSAITNAGTDTFSTFTNGSQRGGPLTRTAGSYSYTVTETDNQLFAGLDSNGFLTNFDVNSSITFNGFSSGIKAIGANFFGNLVNGAYAPGLIMSVTVLEQDGDSFTANLLSTTRDSFFGYIGDSDIASMTVWGTPSALQTQPFLWPSVDNLTLGAPGNAVSEPGTALLLGLGLLGLGVSRRRT